MKVGTAKIVGITKARPRHVNLAAFRAFCAYFGGRNVPQLLYNTSVAGAGGVTIKCSITWGAKPASRSSFIWTAGFDGSAFAGSKRNKFGAKTHCEQR